MTKITNVLNPDNTRQDFTIDDGMNKLVIDGQKLLALPGLIDPHVHFRIPGMPHKEDWITGAKAAFHGGYTTVFDMPNTIPATTTLARLTDKLSIINQQIAQSHLPLKYKLFFGADKNNFDQLAAIKNSSFWQNICGIKVFMGSSTGELLMDDISSLHAVYALANHYNLTIALHAEDELIIKQNTQKYNEYLATNDFSYHSKVRSKEAAIKAIKLVVELSKLYGVTSYVLHVSTKEELELIGEAKKSGVSVYAETCPHYLFLDDSVYPKLLGKAKMNPPLRSKLDQNYLWQALRDGLIDTVASDHAPHTLTEKDQVLCKCPSGIPGIETTLPLLLTAYKQDKITLKRIITLLHNMPKHIFNLPDNDDKIFVNIVDYKSLADSDMYTKTKWSPYTGMNLTGFVNYVYTNGQLFDVTNF